MTEKPESASQSDIPKEPIFADFASIPGVACPCGTAYRGLVQPDNRLCSFHITEISANARTHYHREHTEVYYFLEGSGELELNGEKHPVKEGMAVLIPPHVRHRAIVEEGQAMKIINVVMPPFDPADEWFD